MDTGSTKAQVLEWAAQLLPNGVRFVGGHPMAGKTESGPDAADAKLFDGAVWCLVACPEPRRARRSTTRSSWSSRLARRPTSWTPTSTMAWWRRSATCRI